MKARYQIFVGITFLIKLHNIIDNVWSCAPCTGPWFSVEAKNEERGVSGVSYLRKLYVTVNGITVTLMKARKTLVSMGNIDINIQCVLCL